MVNMAEPDPRSLAFPTMAGEIVDAVAKGGRAPFPFASWALTAQFKYPADAVRCFLKCGSAAEAFFLRGFATRPNARADGDRIICGPTTVELQVRAANALIDVVATRGAVRLAIEIDGMGFHHRKPEQVAKDYIRERRIVVLGYTVVRFTAREAFANADECWRQIDAILASRTAGRAQQ